MEGDSSATVHLILDSGSQRTYITKNLANQLHLKFGNPEGFSVVTFGGSQPEKIQCQPSQLQLTLKDDNIMTLNVSVVPSITGKITRCSLDTDEVKF